MSFKREKKLMTEEKRRAVRDALEAARGKLLRWKEEHERSAAGAAESAAAAHKAALEKAWAAADALGKERDERAAARLAALDERLSQEHAAALERARRELSESAAADKKAALEAADGALCVRPRRCGADAVATTPPSSPSSRSHTTPTAPHPLP